MPCSQWNTLEVPLENGWQCALIPAGQYRDALWLQQESRIQPYPLRRPRWGWPDGRDSLHYAIDRTRQVWRDDHARQRWERDELARQRDEDRGDFYRYFRPNDDLRSITGQRSLETIQAFLSDILGVVHWSQPKTNDDIRRVLCDQVRNGRLVPYMDREWTQHPRVFRRTPGPERWKASAGGRNDAVSPDAVPVITYDEFVALQRTNGELPPLDASTVGASLRATINPQPDLGAPARADGEFGLSGFVKTAASALLGRIDDSDDGYGGNGAFDGDAFDRNPGNRSTPLSDAQAFVYQPDLPASDGEKLAGRLTPNTGAPGTWYTNPGSGQMRLFGNNGNPVVDFDFDHNHGQGIPHAHNWNDVGGDYPVRGIGVPFSAWP